VADAARGVRRVPDAAQLRAQAAFNERQFADAEALLAPDCTNERRQIDALEFIRGRDRVIVGVRGPTLMDVAGEPLEGQIFNVFALRDGRIIRIDDYRRRSEALAAASIAADVGWR
jgi:hypothetical protein